MSDEEEREALELFKQQHFYKDEVPGVLTSLLEGRMNSYLQSKKTKAAKKNDREFFGVRNSPPRNDTGRQQGRRPISLV